MTKASSTIKRELCIKYSQLKKEVLVLSTEHERDIDEMEKTKNIKDTASKAI